MKNFAIYEVKTKPPDNLEFLGETLDFLVVGDVEPAGGDARDAGELVELLGVEVSGDHRATLLHELEGGGSADSYTIVIDCGDRERVRYVSTLTKLEDSGI